MEKLIMSTRLSEFNSEVNALLSKGWKVKLNAHPSVAMTGGNTYTGIYSIVLYNEKNNI